MELKLTISIIIFLKTERIFIILLIMGHFFCLRLAVKLEISVLLNNVIGSLSSRRSSDGDSDRAAEMKKKKKKKRHRDSDPELHSPDAARSHRNRSSEERESRKRHHSDRDFKHDNGFPPEKRRCTDYADGSGGHLLPSNHTTPANGSSYGHLNGQPGIHLVSKITGMLN